MFNFYQLSKLLSILCALIVTSCLSQENETNQSVPIKNIELKVQGLSNFGNILVGDTRETLIIIKNNTNEKHNLQSEISSHFLITEVSLPCYENILPENSTCNARIKFSPNSVGNFIGAYKVGDSVIELTGKGVIGGDILISETSIDLGVLSSGVDYYKTLTLTNVGDSTVIFPDFVFPEGYRIMSNYCGSFLNPKTRCNIRIEIIKPTIGPHIDKAEMVAISKGSGSKKTEIFFYSVVSPGIPSGEIKISSILPSMEAGSEIEEIITTQPILDNHGNIVSDGTPVTVSIENLSLSEESNIFFTQSGIISFKIKSTTKKGPASITIISETAFGLIPLYVRSGLPFGELKIQPYDPILISDGSTNIFLKTEKVYDKFKNIVEDGSEIDLSLSSGSLSADKKIKSPSIRVKTFDGIARFYLISGTNKGPADLTLSANQSGSTYLANGSAKFEFIPGPPFGNISIFSAKESINAINEFSTVTVGPVVDKVGNIVSQNTPVDVVIQNGRTIDDNYKFFTDPEGKLQFILVGSGNRGPINIKAKSLSSSGETEIWAFKDTHLTFQGQKRDDWGLGTGNNSLNSGRVYTITAKGTHTDFNSAKNELPSPTKRGSEIFDYNAISSNDSILYEIQKMSRFPVSSLGKEGGIFPVEVPSKIDGLPQVDSIIFFPERKVVPDFNADVFYPSGTKFMSAPFWTKTVVTPGTNVFGCGDITPDELGNFGMNAMQFSPKVGEFSCKVSDVFVSSNSPLDRPEKKLSDLYYSNIGYVEDPIGCSFEDSQSPIYTFSMGEFTRNQPIEKLVELSNPNLISVQNVGYTFGTEPSQNWTVENVSCGTELLPGEKCTIKITFINGNNVLAGSYSSVLKLISSITPVDINFNVQITGNTTSTGISGGVIGRVNIKSNCFTKLSVFGGHNYKFTNSRNENTIVKTDNLLSNYSGRGQIVSKYDNLCDLELTQESCMNVGFGCKWNSAQESCEQKLDLGAFPSTGISLSPMVPVGRKLYMFSGFDPKGEGGPLNQGLIEYNSESEFWRTIDIENNETNIPEGEELNPKYFFPEERYMHGMTYVPENTSLYIYGGTGLGGIKLNDLWRLNLNPPAYLDEETGELVNQEKKWELICLDCDPLPGESIFNILVKRLFEGPGLEEGELPHSSYIFWDRETQKLNFFFKDKNEVFSMDPLSSNPKSTIASANSDSGLFEFGGSKQVVYNQRLGRIMGYFKSPDDGTHYFKLMDQDPTYKTYIRVKFYIGAPSKRFGTVLTPRVLAYGSSGGDTSGSCGARCGGIKSYIYNHDSGNWFEFGDNTSLSRQELKINGEISFSFNDEDARSMISPEGYVDLLITTKGIPTEFNQIFIDSIFLDGTF